MTNMASILLTVYCKQIHCIATLLRTAYTIYVTGMRKPGLDCNVLKDKAIPKPNYRKRRKFGGIKVWRISKEINLAEESLANISTYTVSL